MANAGANAAARTRRPLQAVMLGCLASLALACSAQPRLTERSLAGMAVVQVPHTLSDENKDRLYGDDGPGGLSFGFASTYLWASFGSVTAYRQHLVISLMAPDASDADYAALPRRLRISYEQRRTLTPRTFGSGSLATTAGLYVRGSVSEPAYLFHYSDRARRLQLVWHVIRKDVDLDSGIAQVQRMAGSFRIVHDPVAVLAEKREAPRQDAALRQGRLAKALAMLQREGYGTPVPGQPVLRSGVYLEWMASPEPRYQLLLPLGCVRAGAPGAVLQRPRPVAGAPSSPDASPAASPSASQIGWREFDNGEWVFSNDHHAYLPFDGVARVLQARQQDPACVYFFAAATVRVEEEEDEARLRSLRWFLDSVPELQRRWRQGSLVAPGKPETN
jgi:hypothetical protein